MWGTGSPHQVSGGDEQKCLLREGGENLEWVSEEADGEWQLRLLESAAAVGAVAHLTHFRFSGWDRLPQVPFPKHRDALYKSCASEWHGRWTVMEAVVCHPDPHYMSWL